MKLFDAVINSNNSLICGAYMIQSAMFATCTAFLSCYVVYIVSFTGI